MSRGWGSEDYVAVSEKLTHIHCAVSAYGNAVASAPPSVLEALPLQILLFGLNQT